MGEVSTKSPQGRVDVVSAYVTTFQREPQLRSPGVIGDLISLRRQCHRLFLPGGVSLKRLKSNTPDISLVNNTLDNLEVGAHDPLTALTVRPVGSAPFSGAITLVSRAAARASFPNAKPGRGFLRLGKKGKQAMAEQVNLRIARQGWDA